MGKQQTKQTEQASDIQRQQNEMYQKAAFDRASNYGDTAFRADKGVLATNPFADPNYIRTLNLLTADSMDAARNDTNEALTNYGTRTGTNAAYLGAAAKENAREMAREGVSTRAKQTADDYAKWQQMRMQSLGNMAELTGQQTNLSTGAGGNANQSLRTQSDLAKQPGFWSQFGQSLLNAGAQVGAAAVPH